MINDCAFRYHVVAQLVALGAHTPFVTASILQGYNAPQSLLVIKLKMELEKAIKLRLKKQETSGFTNGNKVTRPSKGTAGQGRTCGQTTSISRRIVAEFLANLIGADSDA